MFHKVLVANRGEIAVRIIRTCKEMGICNVAVYSDVDANALSVKLSDEACPIGHAEATHSYLNMKKILEVAKRSGVDALHPGYGFPAENPEFAEMCEQLRIVFIGPPARACTRSSQSPGKTTDETAQHPARARLRRAAS